MIHPPPWTPSLGNLMELIHSMHSSNGSQMLLEPMATLLLDSLVKALVAQAVEQTPQLTRPPNQISSSPSLLGSPRMLTKRSKNNAQLACRTNLQPIPPQMELADQDQSCYHHSTQLTTQLPQAAKSTQMVWPLSALTIPLATLCPFLSTKLTTSDPTSPKKASALASLRPNRTAPLHPTQAAQAAQLTIQLALHQVITPLAPLTTQLAQPVDQELIRPLNACNKVFTMLWLQLEMLTSMVSYSSTPTSNKNSWMPANNSLAPHSTFLQTNSEKFSTIHLVI